MNIVVQIAMQVKRDYVAIRLLKNMIALPAENLLAWFANCQCLLSIFLGAGGMPKAIVIRHPVRQKNHLQRGHLSHPLKPLVARAVVQIVPL